MAVEKFSHQVSIPAPAIVVWKRLQEAETWASLLGAETIDSVSYRSDRMLAGFAWTIESGSRRLRGTARTMHAQVNDHMGLDFDAGAAAGAIMATFKQGKDATDLSVELTMEARSVAAPVLYPIIREAMGPGLPQRLEALRDGVAAGPGG
ncbi:MAG: SRPBCC family protein [Acidimicrobiia bacterium]